MAHFVIPGGGIAGVSAALELANEGHTVDLIERFDELLSGSSDDTPCRLGLGFHYIDIETAKKYLKSTIEVLKRYPQFVVTGPNANDKNHPYRRGRYFVVTDSQFKMVKVADLHEALKTEYTRLIKENPANKVLGEPEDFSTELPISKYQHLVNTDRVIAAYETAEQTLNWPALKDHLIKQVNSHPNIKVHRKTTVLAFEQGDKEHDYSRYQVRVKPTEDKGDDNARVIPAEYVINSTWEKIEALDATAGFMMEKDFRTNRTKVMIEVELPPDFEKNNNNMPVNSMFFCFGPHASFTNIGNGRAFISYEPVTNVKDANGIEQKTTGLNVSEFSDRLLAGKATEQEKAEYGRQVIEGITQYIPGLKGARYLNARFGNVRTLGQVNHNDPNSAHHKRSDDDIKTKAIGLVSNPSMKLLYFPEGSKKVSKLVNKHVTITEMIQTSIKNATIKISTFLASVIRSNLDRIIVIDPDKVVDSDTIIVDKMKKRHGSTGTITETISTHQPISVPKEQITKTIESKAKMHEELLERSALGNKHLKKTATQPSPYLIDRNMQAELLKSFRKGPILTKTESKADTKPRQATISMLSTHPKDSHTRSQAVLFCERLAKRLRNHLFCSSGKKIDAQNKQIPCKKKRYTSEDKKSNGALITTTYRIVPIAPPEAKAESKKSSTQRMPH